MQPQMRFFMQADNLLNVSYWIKNIPAWIIAITAYIGLCTWKKKLSYERKMSIVDDFHEAVNNFVLKTNDIIGVLTVMKIGTVKVCVVPNVRCLADTATAMPVNLGEAAIFGTVGIVVAEVPFSKHAGFIAGVGEHLADGDFVLA